MSFEAPLPLSRFVYGTTRLGDPTIPFEDRVRIVTCALEAGLSLHTSDQYGDALNVLKTAFEQREHPPVLIVKIGWDSVAQVRDHVKRQLKAMGIDSMAIGQLCLSGALADDFRIGGHALDGLNAIKA